MDTPKESTPKAANKSSSEKIDLGLSQGQLQEVLGAASLTAGTVAAQAAHHAAAKYLEEHLPTAANAAVADALARKAKSSALKTYGTQVAVSAAVFAVGTATMIGIDRYRHGSDGRRGVGSNQYQDQPAT